MTRERMEVLAALPQALWDAYAFQSDPGSARLSADGRASLACRARQEGTELAKRKHREYAGRSPSAVLADLGITLYDMPPTPFGSKIPFAYFEEPSSVYLDRALTGACQAQLERADFTAFLRGASVEEVLLAHELYHVFALRGETPYTREKHLRLWKLGPFETYRRVPALEELGAMAFAETYLGLTCSPFVLDVPLVCCHDPDQGETLYDRILSLSREREARP